ncbi:hypothetical protein CRE_03276 [Caenorhabditis remanei]|uniref:Uncharacterized protein n=2 Tax=Caenorhabditis remanei TaxID=31234 RepID=E3MMD9_CAERE|nr:hypothetical protein CRE_03276 [Caenorhabditis remanei]
MILKQSVLILFFLTAISAWGVTTPKPEIKYHRCSSCATGGFVLKKWLMQHSESGQSMGWIDWRGTDCADGLVFIVACINSCVTITVEKKIAEELYVYQGTMEECSDDLIHSSPDLPNHGENFKAFYEDAVFVATRMGHKITYNFTRKSFIDLHDEGVEQRHKVDDQVYITSSGVMKVTDFTTMDYVTAVAVVISFFIIIGACKVICCKSSSVPKTEPIFLNGENAELVPLEPNNNELPDELDDDDDVKENVVKKSETKKDVENDNDEKENKKTGDSPV